MHFKLSKYPVMLQIQICYILFVPSYFRTYKHVASFHVCSTKTKSIPHSICWAASGQAKIILTHVLITLHLICSNTSRCTAILKRLWKKEKTRIYTAVYHSRHCLVEESHSLVLCQNKDKTAQRTAFRS